MTAKIFPSRERIADCKVLVVGDVMLDRYWHGDVTRLSGEAPVPIVHIKHEEQRLGGAANVALNIKSLGACVTLMSMVGKDDTAGLLRSMLANNDIKAYLGEDPNMQTIVKLRVIGRSQQMLRIDFEKEPRHEMLTVILERFEAEVNKYDAVLFSDYGKGSLAHISKMIDLARVAGKSVLIDPKGEDWARYRGATVITPNVAEFAQVEGRWTSDEQLREKAQALCRELGLGAVLLTRSAEGMTLFENNQVNSIPAETREVSDVTGAGDTVIATLSVMIACGLSLSQAMIYANQAAGIVVGKFGTASLSYDDLHRFCANRY